MGFSWQNPNYERERRRWRSLVFFAAVLLVAIAAAATWSRRKSAPGAAPAAAGASPRSTVVAVPTRDEPLPASAASPGSAAAGAPLPADGADLAVVEALRPGADAGTGGFAARKAQALALYRQNELPAALEQVQAALALQRDDELLELQARIKREILVQRNYDDARTANFVVLFDGYEHEEMKGAVLDILKDAYAAIGKELNHFPAEPISVILYTGKDFSDVTDAPGWAGGMYGKADGKIRVPVHGAEGQEQALRRVLTHEYVHALLFSLAPASPMWLQEGLAQHLSGDEAIRVAQLIPLGMLEKGFPREARPAYAAYMESLQAVQDLVDEYGMARLRRLLAGLGAGGELETAFSAAYGQSFRRWATQWRPVEREEAPEPAPDREGQEEEDG
jgi:hypothetical protein